MITEINRSVSTHLEFLNEFINMSIREQSLLAIRKKGTFISMDFEKLKTEDETNWAAKLIYYSMIFSIFHDEEIKKKFAAIGFTVDELRWFIKCSQIEDVLLVAWQTEGIHFDKDKVMQVLRNFLILKLNAQLTIWLSDDKDKFTTKHRLCLAHSRLMDRKNYNSPKPKKPRTMLDEALDMQLEKSRQNGDDQFINNSLRYFITGDINKVFLKPCMRKLIKKDDTISKIDFQMTFFDLAKLILVDYEFITDDKLTDLEIYIGETVREVNAREVKAQFLGQ